jgi:quinol monooxygenase YgiN
MIHATIRMELPARKANEVVKILGSVAEQTRVQPGCISCRVYHDSQEEQVIMIEEVWKSQEDLDQHLRSDEYRNVLLVVEMAQKEPEIKFSSFSHSTGVEIIEKARSHGR